MGGGGLIIAVDKEAQYKPLMGWLHMGLTMKAHGSLLVLTRSSPTAPVVVNSELLDQ